MQANVDGNDIFSLLAYASDATVAKAVETGLLPQEDLLTFVRWRKGGGKGFGNFNPKGGGKGFQGKNFSGGKGFGSQPGGGAPAGPATGAGKGAPVPSDGKCSFCETKVGTASRSARNLTQNRGERGSRRSSRPRAWPPQGKGGGKGAGGKSGFGAFGQGFGGKGGGAYGMDLSMIDRPWAETFPGATTTAVGPWQPPGQGVGGPAQAAAGPSGWSGRICAVLGLASTRG